MNSTIDFNHKAGLGWSIVNNSNHNGFLRAQFLSNRDEVKCKPFFRFGITIASILAFMSFTGHAVANATLPYEVISEVTNTDSAVVAEVRNGGFGSAMAVHPTKKDHFYALTDRGPNAATAAGVMPPGIIFVSPDYTPRIGEFRMTPEGTVELVKTTLLKDPQGRPISGLPNASFGSTGETPYALDGSVIVLDPDRDGIVGHDESGLDGEGLVALRDGSFWVSDEYGPHMVHFNAEGVEIGRINPFRADMRNLPGRYLPAELVKRWPNRGMEGLAITPNERMLVGIMQSNLYNPTRDAIGSINLTRIVTVDLYTGANAQYLYRQDAAGLANSEIVALTPTKFLVVERDGKFVGRDSDPIRKNIYMIDLARATNVDRSNDTLLRNNPVITDDEALGLLINGKTLEQIVKEGGAAGNFAAGWDELAAQGIQPATKTLVYDAVAAQGYPHDKMEGLIVLDAHTIAILNDDDFALEPDGKGGVKQKILANGEVDSNVLYIVKLAKPLYTRTTK